MRRAAGVILALSLAEHAAAFAFPHAGIGQGPHVSQGPSGCHVSGGLGRRGPSPPGPRRERQHNEQPFEPGDSRPQSTRAVGAQSARMLIGVPKEVLVTGAAGRTGFLTFTVRHALETSTCGQGAPCFFTGQDCVS